MGLDEMPLLSSERAGPVIVRPVSIIFGHLKLMGEVSEDSRK